MSFPHDANPAASLSSPARLDSWKEIAAYFDRDVRTVQLWEKREALPVHRHEHSARSSVYAFAPELDRWRSTRQSARAQAASIAPEMAEPVAGPVPIAAAAGSGRWRARLMVAAAVLAAAGLAFAGLHHRSAAAVSMPPTQVPPPTPPMVAVLPFEDLSGAHPAELWVDGLTDDLITDLGRAPGLQVISRRSVMSLRDTQEALPVLAGRLHASLIVEGTIRHRDGTTHINAQLVDAAQDRQLWSATYTRDSHDILTLQDEVASAIATAVAEQVTGRESGQRGSPGLPSSASDHTVDPQVRLDYLTGQYLFNRRDEADMLKAVDAFHAAIARAPRYAPAYAGLADCYNLLATWGKLSSAEAFPQARAAALTALRLNPGSAEAYTALALEEFRYEWDPAASQRDFRKALELNPNYAPAHHWYGQSLVDQRRFDEGLQELAVAQNLDPLSAIVSSDVADAELYAGRTAEAIRALRRVLALYPDFVPAHNYLAQAYSAAKEYPDAIREAEVYSRLSGDDRELRSLRLKQQMQAGRVAEARAAAAVLARDGSLGPVQLADLYVSVGETDKAFAALDQARSQRSWWMVTLPVDPSFAALRNDPRFARLEVAIGPSGR